mmetsp:Transcript_2575/g.4821  ORF Transcript_2575/g.4821 Transcript_2575/m.4821 type:complete len:414 (+) Transcript_2575:284-1525(+)
MMAGRTSVAATNLLLEDQGIEGSQQNNNTQVINYGIFSPTSLPSYATSPPPPSQQQPQVFSETSPDITSTNSNKVVVFAPPPPFPTSLQVIKSKFSTSCQTNNNKIKSTLPPYHEIKHSGHALARFSAKSRYLTKKWRPTFWITRGQHKILFFRSKTDFDEWAANPYLTTQERNALVKFIVDFKNDAYKLRNKHLKGYRASPIESKFVKINHKQQQQQQQKQEQYPQAARKMTSHFSLECWTSSKTPSILVEIGGTDAGQVGALHIILVEMIKSSGHEYTPPITHHHSGDGGDGRNHSSHGSSRVYRSRSNSSVWEMHSAGSRSSGIGYYSASNLSYASSIQSGDDSDSQYQQQQNQYYSEWNSHQVSMKGDDSMHRQSSLGSRIMMRMRSRSPSTRSAQKLHRPPTPARPRH